MVMGRDRRIPVCSFVCEPDPNSSFLGGGGGGVGELPEVVIIDPPTFFF